MCVYNCTGTLVCWNWIKIVKFACFQFHICSFTQNRISTKNATLKVSRSYFWVLSTWQICQYWVLKTFTTLVCRHVCPSVRSSATATTFVRSFVLLQTESVLHSRIALLSCFKHKFLLLKPYMCVAISQWWADGHAGWRTNDRFVGWSHGWLAFCFWLLFFLSLHL